MKRMLGTIIMVVLLNMIGEQMLQDCNMIVIWLIQLFIAGCFISLAYECGIEKGKEDKTNVR